MKTQGLLYTDLNGRQEIIVSRSLHDYHSSTDGRVAVDGGQHDYGKVSYDEGAIFQWIWFEYKNVTHADLYNDWNSKKDELGNIWYPTDKVEILEAKDYPDIDSFEWRVETCMWKTMAYDKKPGKMIMLKDASEDHLQAILANCGHISGETRKIINYILKSRK